MVEQVSVNLDQLKGLLAVAQTTNTVDKWIEVALGWMEQVDEHVGKLTDLVEEHEKTITEQDKQMKEMEDTLLFYQRKEVNKVFGAGELLLIFTDQKNMLEAVHVGTGGEHEECSDVMNCPINHFEEDSDEAISLRQGIMKKIGELSAKEFENLRKGGG